MEVAASGRVAGVFVSAAGAGATTSQDTRSIHICCALEIVRSSDRPGLPEPALDKIFGAQPRISSSFDPEFFRKIARLTREQEVLECPAEQNWRDADNDHFRSALRTRRRISFFGWQFLANHAISSHPTLFEARSTDERSPVRRGLRPEQRPQTSVRFAPLEDRAFQIQALRTGAPLCTTFKLSTISAHLFGKKRGAAGLRPTAPAGHS